MLLKKIRKAYREAKRNLPPDMPAVLQDIIINTRTRKMRFLFLRMKKNK